MKMMQESQSARTSIDLENGRSDDTEEEQCCTDVMMAKLMCNILVTALLSPFVICDFYFGLKDDTCVAQQTSQMQSLTMRTYLIVSASLGLVSIAAMNIRVCTADASNKKVGMKFEEEAKCTAEIGLWIGKAFNVSWLIAGCVLFWGYMDFDKCSTRVHDYLFARFIIALVTTMMTSKYQDK